MRNLCLKVIIAYHLCYVIVNVQISPNVSSMNRSLRMSPVEQSWGRSLIFDLKIKDPSNFADLLDDLDHTRGSDLINGDLDQKITL